MNLDEFYNFLLTKEGERIDHSWNGIWGWAGCAVGEFCRSQGFEPDYHKASACDSFVADLFAEMRKFVPGTFELLNTAGVEDYEDLILILQAERAGRITYDDLECAGFDARTLIIDKGLA